MLEEAAYVDPGFFYETVAPLLLIGNTSLIAISTLTSEINFYTRLLRMRDKTTGLPLFTSLSIQLACKQCIDEGKAAQCVHMLHLVPRWQSSDRHVKLKTIMQVQCAIYLSVSCQAGTTCRSYYWELWSGFSCTERTIECMISWPGSIFDALTGFLTRRRRTARI